MKQSSRLCTSAIPPLNLYKSGDIQMQIRVRDHMLNFKYKFFQFEPKARPSLKQSRFRGGSMKFSLGRPHNEPIAGSKGFALYCHCTLF